MCGDVEEEEEEKRVEWMWGDRDERVRGGSLYSLIDP